jgi:hypothetical protein
MCLHWYPEEKTHDERRRGMTGGTGQLDLFVYNINYDGSSYVPVRRRFSIQQYSGERRVSSLPIFPLRFLRSINGIKEPRFGDFTEDQLRQQGLAFMQAVDTTYLSYEGWTVPCIHGTRQYNDSNTSGFVDSHYVQSDVIIGCLEGYKQAFRAIGPEVWHDTEDTMVPPHSTWIAQADGFRQWSIQGHGRLGVTTVNQVLQTKEEYVDKKILPISHYVKNGASQMSGPTLTKTVSLNDITGHTYG